MSQVHTSLRSDQESCSLEADTRRELVGRSSSCWVGPFVWSSNSTWLENQKARRTCCPCVPFDFSSSCCCWNDCSTLLFPFLSPPLPGWQEVRPELELADAPIAGHFCAQEPPSRPCSKSRCPCLPFVLARSCPERCVGELPLDPSQHTTCSAGTARPLLPKYHRNTLDHRTMCRLYFAVYPDPGRSHQNTVYRLS